MIIAGAGMAGLIAANYFRKQNPNVVELQKALPKNHGALLRFRTDKVFNVVGLKARKVMVRKSVVFGDDFMVGANPYLANMYSMKVTGKVEDRSIWNLDTEPRYIAPDDFIERLADGCNIEYNNAITATDKKQIDSVISTIPMPVLMRLLGWKDIPKFDFKPIWTAICEFPNVDVNQTIYFPDMEVPYYRASFVGSKFIVEFIRDPGDEAFNLCKEVIDYFGIACAGGSTPISKMQPFGKMLPIDDELRKEFMHWATGNFNIYSLGRFATWRPILLDDLINDLAVIERMMSSKYEARRLT
jgi:hypothetical protein